MPALQANRKTRQILLGAAVATLLGTGGASVAYASPHGTEHTGYAMEITAQDDAASQNVTKDECERQRQLQQDGQQETQAVTPATSAAHDVRGDL